MPNPVLVENRRGGRVESFHRGSIAVLDADGGVVFSAGDIERLVYPRSANKAIQALVLVESGAVERFGLTDAEIALSTASHMGETEHAETALSMLRKAGRNAGTLECGSHWPSSSGATRALAAAGLKPGPLHNNCSGKHAGFICAACASDVEPGGYVRPHHPTQRLVAEAMESLTGAQHDPDACGTDGCSIPTFAVPLRALAHGFARFATGTGLEPRRAAAARRIRQAIAAAPFMLSGHDRFDTLIAEAFGERVLAKVGAEGVYCGALPELGLGIAIKCDDGSMPAAEVMMASVIERLLRDRSGAEEAALQKQLRRPLKNWNGMLVGEIRPAVAD